MTTAYLAGHGSWNIKTNGFTTVPRGTTVIFYTESMKNMFTTDMLSIIAGTYKGEVKQVYDSGSQVPNYTLSSDPKSQAACRQILQNRTDLARANGGVPAWSLVMPPAGVWATLAQLMDAVGPRNIVWCACRHTGLKNVGGKSVGVNGAQGSLGSRTSEGTIGKGDIHFNPGAFNAALIDKSVDVKSHLEYALKSRRKALGY